MRAQGVLGRLLDPPVERRPHVCAGHRLESVEHADQTPVGVDLDLLTPVPAPEVLVVEPLEPRLADEVASAHAASPEVGVRGLADVAEQMGREPDPRVRALWLDVDRHPGQIEAPLLDADDLLEREPAREPDRPRRVRRDACDSVPKVARRHMSSPASRSTSASRSGTSRGTTINVKAGRLSTSGSPVRSNRIPRDATIGRSRSRFRSESAASRSPLRIWRLASWPPTSRNAAASVAASRRSRRREGDGRLA